MIKFVLICALVGFIPSPSFAEILTTVRVMKPNTVIQATDLSVVEASFPGALNADAQIIGLEVRSTLYPGRPIRAQDVGPAALVERNSLVTLIFRRGGLSISTDARALSRGAIGDIVRVMNLSSKSTVSGKVARDGSVIVNGRK